MFNPFNFTQPYPASSWQYTQRFAQCYSEIQQKLMAELLEWNTWQQSAWQEALLDIARGWSHSAHLIYQPKTYYRYLRLHWQKPYLKASANMLTASRLLTTYWLENCRLWQTAWMGSQHRR